MLNKDQLNIIVLVILVVLSRIFFLNEGYGVEEDSWGLVLNAYEIYSSKAYSMSRLPGHPFQEIILALFWNIDHSPIFYNGLSAFFSLFAGIYFYLILKEFRFKNPLPGALALVMTPVILIAGTYTIDYIWALAFILMSYYYLLKDKNIFAGILLGMAVGCRITSGAMLLPFILTIMLYASRRNLWNSVVFTFFCFITSLLMFFPVYFTYGIDFLDYYQLPYPPLLKALYKGSIGVFGAFASLIIVFLFLIFVSKQKLNSFKKLYSKNISFLVFPWILAIVLYILAYFNYPQKSAFLIPAIPFFILLSGYLLRPGYFKILAYSLLLSSFVISVDITDKYRGSDYSGIAFTFNVSDQNIYIDPLNGPIFADRSKRINKQKFTDAFIEEYNNINKKTVIICGWWYNQIKVNLLNKQKNTNVRLVSFAEEYKLKNFIKQGYIIKHLPEQAEANDSKYFDRFTSRYSTLFFL